MSTSVVRVVTPRGLKINAHILEEHSASIFITAEKIRFITSILTDLKQLRKIILDHYISTSLTNVTEHTCS